MREIIKINKEINIETYWRDLRNLKICLFNKINWWIFGGYWLTIKKKVQIILMGMIT